MIDCGILVISTLLGVVPIGVIVVGYLLRKPHAGKTEGWGIGWQFIRYTVIAMTPPIIAILALNNALTTEVAVLLSGTLGYAFGNRDEGRETKKKNKSTPEEPAPAGESAPSSSQPSTLPG
ncbi:hypothetical protein FKB34_08730 [Glycocaulis profundi]|nr:hypothetical protein FKB34_08730 [Glycocaulis profundi]